MVHHYPPHREKWNSLVGNKMKCHNLSPFTCFNSHLPSVVYWITRKTDANKKITVTSADAIWQSLEKFRRFPGRTLSCDNSYASRHQSSTQSFDKSSLVPVDIAVTIFNITTAKYAIIWLHYVPHVINTIYRDNSVNKFK